MAFLCKMFRLLKELTKNDYRETQSTFQITIISCEGIMNIHSIHYYKAFLRNIWNFGLISTVIMGIIKCFPTYEVCTLLWSHTLWNNDHLHLTICVMLFFCQGTDYIGTIGSRLLNPDQPENISPRSTTLPIFLSLVGFSAIFPNRKSFKQKT